MAGKGGSFLALISEHRRRLFYLLVGVMLTVGTSVTGNFITSA